MLAKRLGLLTACALSLGFAIGVAPAGAATPARVMRFVDHHVMLTWIPVGDKGSPATAASTVGSTAVLTGRLYNSAAQFGKAPGTPVGRFLLDCTVLNIPADGLCSGIVHLPDGFFLFGGNGPFVPTPVRHYAITGGVGPYANARGQVIITNTAQGASLAEVRVFP